MNENNLEDKMNGCRWYGTPQCPHKGEMEDILIPEKPQGAKIQYISYKISLKNAQFCKDCNKYEQVIK